MKGYLLTLFILLFTSIVISNAQKPCVQHVYRGPDNPMNCVCNSTYCDEMPPLGVLAFNQAAVYTSSQSGKRFERTTPTFTSGSILNSIQISVDESVKKQTIFGFGGAITDSVGVNVKSLSTGAQENLMRTYYGPEGIGYTVARIPIASTDYSTRVYSYDDVDGDLALTNFALAPEDLNLKIPLVKWAQTLSGNKLRLFASVWSAPGWMKVVGTMYGGGPLKGDMNGPYYQTWANYFVRFFEEYAKNNVTFWGVTMENEPEMGADLHYRFQALFYNASMERDFAKGYWGQALRNNQVTQNLKLMFLDGERPDIVNWSNEILGDPAANKVFDGIAVHWYWDSRNSPTLLTQAHDNFPDKFILYTEACQIAHVNLGSWGNGDSYAHSISSVLNNWVVGWTDWNIALNPQGGPSWANSYYDSPIIVFNGTDTFEKQPMYYAMGHFSKFIVPDSVVIGLNMKNVNSTTNLEGVAALTPSGQKVIVLNNRDVSNTYAVSILNSQGNSFNLNLEPRSFTTLVYN